MTLRARAERLRAKEHPIESASSFPQVWILLAQASTAPSSAIFAHAIVVWVPCLLCAVAAVIDLRTREIPDWISVVTALWGLCAVLLGMADFGLLSMLAAMAIAFGLGVVLFKIARFGGGDVKLFTALAACVGLQGLLPLCVWVGIMGGVMATVALVRRKREIAYAPAIALGLCLFLSLREFLPDGP